MHHPRRIAQTTGVHGHSHDWLRDGRRLTGVGILQKQCPSVPLAALPAAIASLALRRRAMPDDIGPVARETMQHWGKHRSSHADWCVSFSMSGEHIHRSATPSGWMGPCRLEHAHQPATVHSSHPQAATMACAAESRRSLCGRCRTTAAPHGVGGSDPACVNLPYTTRDSVDHRWGYRRPMGRSARRRHCNPKCPVS